MHGNADGRSQVWSGCGNRRRRRALPRLAPCFRDPESRPFAAFLSLFFGSAHPIGVRTNSEEKSIGDKTMSDKAGAKGGTGHFGKDLPAAKSGEFVLGGNLRVWRLGFGAMRITGKGVWGAP